MTQGYDNTAPLYDQVRQRILADLGGGSYPPGDYLPAEPELCRLYGVSRITLRRAVSELCGEGVLKKVHGRGTLVTAPKLRQALVSLSGFADSLSGSGHAVGHHVVEARISAECSEGRLHLQAAPGDDIVWIRRLLLKDASPLTLEDLFFRKERYPLALAPVADGASFYEALRHLYGESPQSARRTINVDFPSAEEAALLNSSSMQPVFRIDKTVFGHQREPIAFSRLVTPADRVTYTLDEILDQALGRTERAASEGSDP